MGGIEGKIQINSFPSAVSSTRGGLTATTNHHILTLHNRLVQFNKVNTREIILERINAAMRSGVSDPAILSIF